MKLILPALLLIGLFGCVSRPYQSTQAEIQGKNINEKIDAGGAAYDKCIENIQSNKSVQLINRDVLFGGADGDKVKLQLMTNQSKISPQQKTALLVYVDLRNYCNTQSREFLKEFPTLLSVRDKYINSLDLVYAKLLNQEITIAVANREKSSNYETFKSEFSTATQSIFDKLTVQRDEELRRRQNANIAQGMAIQNMINTMPKQTNCTTSYVGNQAYTNCY